MGWMKSSLQFQRSTETLSSFDASASAVSFSGGAGGATPKKTLSPSSEKLIAPRSLITIPALKFGEATDTISAADGLRRSHRYNFIFG